MKPLTCITVALLLAVPVLTQGQDKTQPKKPDDAKRIAIYDEKADAKALIEKAQTAAKRANRRVLIQWGGNGSASSVLLHEKFKTDRTLSKTLLYEYDVVYIDSNTNMELAAKYGADLKKNDVPFFTVLDGNGKVLINQATVPFETKVDDKNGHDPKKLQDFLAAHQATPLNAEDELNAALSEAAKNDRKVFLHFGAPWCGWCKKLDAWLVRPEIAPVFAKEFVDIEIDQDRMQGAKEVQTRFRGDKQGGIPWFVILDAKGKAITNSDGPKGNIGFPYTDDEIVHFVTMLKAAQRRLTDNDIDMFRKSLVELAKAK